MNIKDHFTAEELRELRTALDTSAEEFNHQLKNLPEGSLLDYFGAGLNMQAPTPKLSPKLREKIERYLEDRCVKV